MYSSLLHLLRSLIVGLAFSAVLFLATVLPTQGFSSDRGTPPLTGEDRAAILQYVIRDIFNPKRNYEGSHYLFADGARSEWLPRIPNFNLILINRQQLESLEVPYYVIRLKPSAHSVNVTVTLYDKSGERDPELELYYQFRRIKGKWRGIPKGGWGR